jgi:lauroyl/myristoyl acyltransferase
MFRERRKSVVETPLEIVLYSILRALEQAGTEFDPRMHVRGFELIQTSMKSDKGVLLISGRVMLAHAFLRYLADQGYSAWLVAPHPYPLFGRRTTVPTISPTVKYFLEVREHLKKREIVMATPDRGRARTRTLSVKTVEGTVHFAPPLIEVALNAKANVIFIRTWLKDGVITIELSPSTLSGEPEANAIALQYAELVRRHVAERDSFISDQNYTLSGSATGCGTEQ